VDFIEDLGVDSLMALEVMVVLEKKYGVKIAESELREVTNLKKAYDLLTEKLKAA
ncbi:acyl carrier protein, partial [Saccharothrix algeriensis]